MKKNNGLTIGVTGGIGSGKSEVCRLFSALGVKIIFADSLAKEIMETNVSVRKKIERAFGKDVYIAEGTLNRQGLAEMIFSDARLRKKIDSIVHPHVLQVLKRIIFQGNSLHQENLLVIEAALIFESGADKMMDYIIVVDADEEKRIDRVVRRDGTSREEVLRRSKVQMSPERKVRKADFVIQNNGTFQSLETKVKFLHHLLLKLCTTKNRS